MRWLALHAHAVVMEPLLWSIALVYASQSQRLTTRASAIYLERILGRRPGLWDLHRHTNMFAHVFVDRVKLLSGGLDRFNLQVRGQDLIRRQHASGCGGVLVGAHFGSFEALRAFDRMLPGLQVHYLMYPEHATISTGLLNQLNPSVAERIIPLQDGQTAMLQVFEALNNGDFVAFLGDRLVDTSIRGQIQVPFLGDTIKVPTSPYIAAMAARVPLFFCTAPRLGKDHYAIEFSMLYDGSPVDRAERDDRIAALAESYTAKLDDMCRRYPYNWFNFFDIWSE
ncbi:MAG: hypothetical protein AAF563_03205 [Pseudomonadota bacterium]